MSRVESESKCVGLESESSKIGTRVRVQGLKSPSLDTVINFSKVYIVNEFFILETSQILSISQLQVNKSL